MTAAEARVLREIDAIDYDATYGGPLDVYDDDTWGDRELAGFGWDREPTWTA